MTTYGVIIFTGFYLLIALLICAEVIYIKYANTRKIAACLYKFLRANKMRKIAHFIYANF